MAFRSEIKISSLHSEKDQQTPLELDIVSLTLLLKSLGFKLNYLDFEKLTADTINDRVSIEIKCQKSGLASRLSYDLVKCNCPAEKGEHDSAFWEVQGTSPKLMKCQSQVRDTSSSLLPEMSDSCAVVTKQILSNLLKYYRDDMQAGQQKAGATNLLSTQTGPSIVITSPRPSPNYTPPAESPFASKVGAANSIAEVKPVATTPSKNSILEKIMNAVIPDSSPVKHEVIEIVTDDEHNTTQETRKSLDFANAMATSSPRPMNDSLLELTNKVTSEINKSFENDSKRDIQVIQALTDARQKIDSALIFIKFNLAHDASQNSIVTTPQTMIRRNAPTIQRSNSSIATVRRRSLGTTPSSGLGLSLLRKSATPAAVKPKTAAMRAPEKVDTPRPLLKKPVASVAASKKPPVSVTTTTSKMTVTATRTVTSKVNSGLTGRSGISSSLSRLPTEKK